MENKNVEFLPIWNELRVTIDKALKLIHVDRDDWVKGIRDVYELCVAHPEPHGDKLFKATKKLLSDHLKEILMLVTEDPTPLKVLNSYHFYWKRYSEGLEYLQNLFTYMNSQHANKRSDVNSRRLNGKKRSHEFMEIAELGMELWRLHLFYTLKGTLLSVLLDCVNKDRIGDKDVVRDEVVKDVFSSFVWIDSYKPDTDRFKLYQESVEVPYEEATRTYYRDLSGEWIRQYSIQVYTDKALEAFEEEKKRSTRYLRSSSFELIERCVQDGMVGNHLQILLDESKKVINGGDTKAIAKMSTFLRAMPKALAQFIAQFRIYMEAEGLKIMESLFATDQFHAQFVPTIFEFRQKYSKFIADVFWDCADFKGALNGACSLITNFDYSGAKETNPAELLAKYCDQVIKKSTQEEFKCKLNVAMIVFKHIENKDEFQKHYSRNLAKRLLNSIATSTESEQLMIEELNETCGKEFTNKLHKMLEDAKVSEELTQEFKSIEKSSADYRFVVAVLQQGAWPMATPCGLALFPAATEMNKDMQKFETFYRHKFVGRKLIWAPECSTVEVSLMYLKKPYVLKLQAFQLKVLLMFEKQDTLTCADISQAMGLQQQHFALLQKNVMALVDVGVITASNSDLKDDTVLALNMSFSSSVGRIRVKNFVQMEEQPQVTPQPIDDKAMFLQAAIVRIMKARKIICHRDLMRELTRQCDGFVPRKSTIKRVIESLMDREYMEMMPDGRSQYRYVA